MEEPEGQVVTLGTDTVLKCRFNFNTTCVWEMDGAEISIEGPYQYLNGKNGKDTDDCSFQILKVQPQHLGEWRCSQAAEKISDKLHSKLAMLMGNV